MISVEDNFYSDDIVNSVDGATGHVVTDPTQHVLRTERVEPTLDLNFTAPEGVLFSEFNRLSAGGAFNDRGVLQSVPTGNLRIDHDGAGLLRGGLFEGARTNSLRVNNGSGAVAGTPGTMPTTWSWNLIAGLSTQVVGTGTEDGIRYVDLRVFGAATGQSALNLESSTFIVAAQNQVWTFSSFIRLVGGSLANVSALFVAVAPRTAAGAGVAGGINTLFAPLTSRLSSQRYSVTCLHPDAATERTQPRIVFNHAGTVDFTLRIGLPQHELAPSMSSPIETSGTAATRAADVLLIPTADWYDPSEGTFYVDAVVGPGFGTAGIVHAFFQLDDGTSNNRFLLYHSQVGSILLSPGAAGTYHTITSAADVVTPASPVKLAAVYGAGRLALFAKGEKVGSTVTTMTTPPQGMTAMAVGGSRLSANQYLNGGIRRLTYWPKALDDVVTARMTAA